MKYSIDKYKIIKHKHSATGHDEIIAISTYAGQWVKGKAICHSDDNFNEETGTKLAVARCAEKIARKRKARAKMLVKRAENQLAEATRYLEKMKRYYSDAHEEEVIARHEVAVILAEMM
jgi:hypothetical protein